MTDCNDITVKSHHRKCRLSSLKRRNKLHRNRLASETSDENDDNGKVSPLLGIGEAFSPIIHKYGPKTRDSQQQVDASPSKLIFYFRLSYKVRIPSMHWLMMRRGGPTPTTPKTAPKFVLAYDDTYRISNSCFFKELLPRLLTTCASKKPRINDMFPNCQSLTRCEVLYYEVISLFPDF